MAPVSDPTEALLERLEPELERVQATVDARLTRERALVDGLTAQEGELVGKRARADAEFLTLTKTRDALTEERNALSRSSAKGSRLRAALWDTAVVGLMAGAIVPLGIKRANGFFVLGIGAAVAGAFLTALWQRWRR